jgi:hypothetical protein
VGRTRIAPGPHDLAEARWVGVRNVLRRTTEEHEDVP